MEHRSIIDAWPSLTHFANDIGVAYGTAKAMRRRGSIPSNYWASVVTAAERQGIEGITLKVLADACATQPTRVSQPDEAAA